MPDDLDSRIRAAEAELAELRGQRPRPLTLAEIRSMSKEQVDAEWQRVKASLSSEREPERKKTRPSPGESLNQYFSGPGSDTSGEREMTPEGLRPKGPRPKGGDDE